MAAQRLHRLHGSVSNVATTTPPHPNAGLEGPGRSSGSSARAGQWHSKEGLVVRKAARRLGLGRIAAEIAALAGVSVSIAGQRFPALMLFTTAFVIVVARAVTVSRSATSSPVSPTGTATLPRVLIVLGAATIDQGLLIWPAFVVACGVAAEAALAPFVRLAVPLAVNLPGIAVRTKPLITPRWGFAVSTTAIGGLVVLAAAGTLMPSDLRAAGAFALVAVQWLALITIGVDAFLRIVRRRRAEAVLPNAVSEYAPTFLLHWYAPPESSHQVTMWLPYLERLGRRFLIVVRNAATFDEIAARTSRPVILRRYAPELPAVIAPTLRTVFYVNTSSRNEPMLAYLGLQHIQLNHGDSDKAPSYRRAFRVFDKNFVAGQAAIDRFAQHGIEVPASAFEIVGRPQVEAIELADRPISHHPHPVVLYAPTWFGYFDDSRYSSLTAGVDIVAALLARECTVIFRPHPWSRHTPALSAAVDKIDELLRQDHASHADRPHLFGPVATDRLSLVDCFNRSHAMIADVSSVVADYLYSEKPLALTMTEPRQSIEEYLRDVPIARAAYLLASDLSDCPQVFDDLLIRDPKLLQRRALKTYYLGPFPAASYADGFVDAARRYV
ncbi:MAG TPA: CDP-glycerol glycerophosphotransferase family protein [Microlunatus sp.]|nr:CDP-glycerol glycerophosphotransferase family protein [Microlunatus sp.]